MRNFQKKRGFRNIMHSKPVLVFLTILLLVFAYGVLGFMNKMRITIENKKIAEKKVEELKKEKEKLSYDISRFETEDGVEESIRTKFGLAKEGESLIIVVDDKNSPTNEGVEKKGFFSFLFFWKDWFK